jgi:hypothetical protein
LTKDGEEILGREGKTNGIIEFSVKPQIVRNFCRLWGGQNPMKCSGGHRGPV